MKKYYDKRLCEAHERLKVSGWIFSDQFDAVFKPSFQEKFKMTQCSKAPMKFITCSHAQRSSHSATWLETSLSTESHRKPHLLRSPRRTNKMPPRGYGCFKPRWRRIYGLRIVKNLLKRHGTIEFLVQWAGDYEPTWKLRLHVPKELISRYFERQYDPHYDESLAELNKKWPTFIPSDSAVPSTPQAQ